MSIPADLQERYERLLQLSKGSPAQFRYAQFTKELIERIGRLEDDNQRLTDLVRWCRSELFDEKLIDKEEFARLVEDGPVHCEDCSCECENHDGEECVTIYELHRRLKVAINAFTKEG